MKLYYNPNSNANPDDELNEDQLDQVSGGGKFGGLDIAGSLGDVSKDFNKGKNGEQKCNRF